MRSPQPVIVPLRETLVPHSEMPEPSLIVHYEKIRCQRMSRQIWRFKANDEGLFINLLTSLQYAPSFAISRDKISHLEHINGIFLPILRVSCMPGYHKFYFNHLSGFLGVGFAFIRLYHKFVANHNQRQMQERITSAPRPLKRLAPRRCTASPARNGLGAFAVRAAA